MTYLVPFLAVLVFMAGCADTTENPTEEADMGDSGMDAGSDMSVDLSDTEDMAEHPYADSLFLSDTFLNIAHRGGGKLAPEETLEAYANALSVGAHIIECDVHTSSDGVVVCIHDDSVDRTTDGTGRIKDMTLAELKALDAGYSFSADDGNTFPYRGQGVTMITLDEMFEAYPEEYIAIEIKQDDPPMLDAFLEVVDAHDAASRIVVASFSDETIQELRLKRPDLITGLAVGEMIELKLLTEEKEQTYVPPGLMVQAPADGMTAKMVERVHRLGMKIQVWTVNSEPLMREMIDLGVDGIFTDDPELLDQVIN